jgi:hypothetical protein
LEEQTLNFLLHYITDHQKGNSYYNTGLIIPDLAKGAVVSFTHSPPIQHALLQQIHEGSLQHIKTDKLFHASLFFEKYNNGFNQLLKQFPFSPALQRKWFIAHILFELMLDKVFVIFKPHLVKQFYADLLSIDNDYLHQYLVNLGAKDTVVFINRFNHFREVQYINYYTDNIKLLYSLNRIMLRVGLPELSKNDGELMLDVMNHIEKHYFANPVQIETELKAIFK